MEYLEQIYEKIYVITEILNVIYDEIKELNKQSKFSDFKINFSWHLNLWAKKKRVANDKLICMHPSQEIKILNNNTLD